MRRVKTAIIGGGFMGVVHAEAVRRLGNVDVAAVAARNDQTAKKFGDSTGVEKAYGDYKQLMADPAIEAVHICTPNAPHYAISRAAMEAGKAVVCEKPLSTSVEEARQMVELAEKTGVANCVNHNLR